MKYAKIHFKLNQKCKLSLLTLGMELIQNYFDLMQFERIVVLRLFIFF
jgi:hypothetical protein